MSVIKNSLKDKFLSIPNQIIEDSNLSHGAFRVYCYLAGKPEGWNVRNTDIQKRLGIGQPQTIANYFKELVTNGWIKRDKSKNKQGKLIGGYDYRIMEKPHCGKSLFREKTTLGETHIHSNTELNSNIKKLSNKERESRFLILFNKLKKSKTGSGNFKVLSTTDKNNLKNLRDYGSDEFKIAINEMLDNKWAKDTGNQTPSHILRIDNFNRYLSSAQSKGVTREETDEERAARLLDETKKQ